LTEVLFNLTSAIMNKTMPPVKKNKKPVVQAPQPKRERPPRRKRAPAAQKAKPRESPPLHGVDLRRLPQLPFARANKPSGQTSVIAVEQDLDQSSVIGVAVGIVSRLVDIGYASGYTVSDPMCSTPYWLTQFLINQMLLAARGAKLTVERVPMGLLSLFDALRPVNCPYKTGQVAYAWNQATTGPIVLPTIVTYGSLNMNLGIIATVTASTNGYSSIAPPMAYSEENGFIAWNLMLEMLGTEQPDTPTLKLVDPIVDTIMKKDASAFATVYPQISSGSVAAYTSQLFNATKIRYPLYSVFVGYSDDTLVSSESHIFAGSPRWLGGRLLTLADIRYSKNKARPVFQPVDFNDLYDLLANIIGRACELTAASNVSTFTDPTCPLTSPQVALMLRGLIAAFTNKSMPSDMAITDDSFSPLQFPYCCANVSAIAKTCTLPFYFVENLRALCTVSANIPGPKSVDQQLIFMPVYGVYGEKRIDYNYYYGVGNNSNVPLYTTANANFDIVDLLTTSNDYMAVTGEALTLAISVWNNWVSQLSAVCPMASLSTTANNPALYATLYQRGFYYNVSFNPNLVPTTVKQTKTQSRDMTPLFTYKSLVKVVRSVNPSQQNGVCEKYIASNMSMNESIYELMSSWVLPRVFVRNKIAQQKYVGNFIMPYVVASNSDFGLTLDQTTYTTLESKWRAAAHIATHQPTAEKSELLQILWKATEKGEAGFLGSILGEFAAQATGIPLFATLGTMLPF